MGITILTSRVLGKGDVVGPLWRPHAGLPQVGDHAVIRVIKTEQVIDGIVIRTNEDTRLFEVEVASDA